MDELVDGQVTPSVQGKKELTKSMNQPLKYREGMRGEEQSSLLTQ